MEEVGCLRNPGASTIGSQLLDGDSSHGRLLLATHPRALTQRENAGTQHTDKTVECEGGYVVVGEEPKLKKVPTLEEMLMLKETLTPSKPLKGTLIQEHVESWCTCTSKCH